jgi:hypothetical protein
MRRGTLQSKADPRYTPLNWLKQNAFYSDGFGADRYQGP